ncbi:MAG: MBL fold metallo-hydrolase [Methanocellales archaeon]|nr:MBL fold metallo-hydrolase [Methanocellales archaeon]
MQIFFLGSGGGRFATITQKRCTGGFRLHAEANVHVDPGPGALVRSHVFGIDPTDLDAILITHAHPDHYTDCEVLIEAMTRGATKKRGTIIGNKTTIEGTDFGGPVISKFHRSIVSEQIVMQPGQEAKIKNLRIEATKAVHHDPDSLGFRFHTPSGIVSYTSDTEYFDELPDIHKDARVLIASAMRPREDRIPNHMCTEDCINLIDEVKPEIAILTHFGMKMIFAPPEKEARQVAERTKVKTIAARLGLVVDMGEEVKTRYAREQVPLDRFL